MNRLGLKMLYKAETGDTPFDEEEVEMMTWRSKGQWILEMTDVEKFGLSGNRGTIRFNKPDTDYVKWLEEKLMELLPK